MRVYEGNILTCDRTNRVARYLVTDCGRITYVGDTLPEKYAKAPKTELGKRALIPAFADTHIHFASYAIFRAGLNVMEARSNGEILKMLGEYAANSRD